MEIEKILLKSLKFISFVLLISFFILICIQYFPTDVKLIDCAFIPEHLENSKVYSVVNGVLIPIKNNSFVESHFEGLYEYTSVTGYTYTKWKHINYETYLQFLDSIDN